MSNRRRFERFAILEDAIALDDLGRRLGRVTVAGGGGMAIALEDSDVQYQPGQRLRITVIEPGPGERHTLNVEVRSHNENSLGVEFVSGQPA